MDALEAIGLDDVASQGYCFQVDLTLRAVRAGLRVVELPITFVEREVGSSKMSGHIVREALTRITEWGVQYRAGQLRRIVRREPVWHHR
jgi:dolichol-phosphate mannosyltransferase